MQRDHIVTVSPRHNMLGVPHCQWRVWGIVMVGPSSNIWVLTGMAVGMFAILFAVGLYPV